MPLGPTIAYGSSEGSLLAQVTRDRPEIWVGHGTGSFWSRVLELIDSSKHPGSPVAAEQEVLLGRLNVIPMAGPPPSEV